MYHSSHVYSPTYLSPSSSPSHQPALPTPQTPSTLIGSPHPLNPIHTPPTSRCLSQPRAKPNNWTARSTQSSQPCTPTALISRSIPFPVYCVRHALHAFWDFTPRPSRQRTETQFSAGSLARRRVRVASPFLPSDRQIDRSIGGEERGYLCTKEMSCLGSSWRGARKSVARGG